MTIQDQINARDNPGPDARFCPHCGEQLGPCVAWTAPDPRLHAYIGGEPLMGYSAQCHFCEKWFTNTAVLRWGG